MERSHLVSKFLAAQDSGISALIQISEAEIKIEEGSKLIFVEVPEFWLGIAITFINMKHLINTPSELKEFTVEVVTSANLSAVHQY